MGSKIELIKQSFGLIKQFFYYRNKWSNSRPNSFGNIKRLGLISGTNVFAFCAIFESATTRLQHLSLAVYAMGQTDTFRNKYYTLIASQRHAQIISLQVPFT